MDPDIPNFSMRVTRPASDSDIKVDWDRCIQLAREGAREAVIAWFAGSSVRGGRVDGAVGRLTAGSLQSIGFFRQVMWTKMNSGGAPELISCAFSDTLWNHWKAWFDGYQIELEYPSLAAVEAPAAQGVANKPVLFSKGQSTADALLTGERLTEGIARALYSVAFQQGAYDTCFRFSEWFTQTFDEWRSKTLLMNVLASGPVPSYAPPDVMSGPVVGGTLSSPRPALPDLGAFLTARYTRG